MKLSILLFSSVFGSAAAFSPAVLGVRASSGSSTSLGYLPKNFDRAAECASVVGECSLEEIETLAVGKSARVLVSMALNQSFTLLSHLYHRYPSSFSDLKRQHDTLSSINRDPEDSEEVLKVAAILAVQYKLITSDPEYQKEYEAAHSARNQIVSFPTEEDYSSDFGDQYPSKKSLKEQTPLSPMQSELQAGTKDFGVNIHYDFGPSAKELAAHK
jgi:hypothetical protein